MGKSPRAEDEQFASDMLNSMVKMWQADGIKLWNRREGTLFTDFQDGKYSLSLTGDHATSDEHIKTLLNGALVISATAVTVDSTAGMTAADNIGIKLDDNTRHWDTIATVDSSTTLTLTTGVASAASDNLSVVSYTTKIDRPLELTRVSWLDVTVDTDVPMELVRHEEFFDIPDKTNNGRPTVAYYDKKLGSGVLHLWPRPDNVDTVINFTYHESIEDFDSNGDSPDFPQEWLLALQYNLAVLLAASPYGQSAKLQVIKPMADEFKRIVEEFNNDDVSLLFSPELRGNSRIISR